MLISPQSNPQQENNFKVSSFVSADAMVYLLGKTARIVLVEITRNEISRSYGMLQNCLQPQPSHSDLPEKIHLLFKWRGHWKKLVLVSFWAQKSSKLRGHHQMPWQIPQHLSKLILTNKCKTTAFTNFWHRKHYLQLYSIEKLSFKGRGRVQHHQGIFFW